MARHPTTIGILIAALLIAFSHIHGQTLQAGAGVAAIVPAGDFGGSTVDYYGGTQYGLSTGFALHGRARVGLGGLAIMGELSYASLSNSGDAEPGQGKVEVSQNILSFKLGPEYHISLPAVPLKPYIGAHVGLNVFDGEAKFQGVSRVSSGTYEVKSASRIGIGAGVGAIFSMGLLTSLDISVRYDLLNTFGKKWEDIDPRNQRIDSYLTLNDEKDPLYAPNNTDHFVKSAREIHAIVLSLSLMFGL